MKKELKASFMFALMLITVCSAGFSANAISVSKESISPDCETCNRGCDMALVEIVPYDYGPIPYFEYLLFSCKVKNAGDKVCSPYGFNSVAYKIKTNEVVATCSVRTVGELWPGEEKTYLHGTGLVFDGIYYPPTYFRVNFTTYPNDSNRNNNYAEAKYKIWGGFMGPADYQEVENYTLFPVPRTVNNPFIERFPLLNLLLQRLRI